MMGESKNSYNLGFGSWMFIQCALLVTHYGFNKTLPWWVLWLPSMALGAILSVIGIILLIAFIIAVVTD